MLNEDSITELKQNLRGRLTQPGDADYDEARKVYNGMIHKKPRLIARCADAADVIRSVNFARENDLLVSIRGGGHNAGGLGICDDCLVIDLAAIKYTRVDPAARTVTAGGGCVWGDVDHATHAFGFATPSGIISTTGVGGLTLGGGVGHLTRKCGLSIDNLLSADVVLADGKFVKASSAVSRTSSHEKNVRRRLDIHGAARKSRRNIQTDSGFQKACAGFRGAAT